MNLNINDIPVCVINLKHRTERLQRSILQLNNFYGCESYEFYLIEGVVNRKPMVGIATSHMNAIQLAKDNQWEYVCICEDDLHFQSMLSKEYANKCFENIPDDFEILLGGIYTGNPKPYNEYWNTIDEFSGTHYYIVRNTAYDRILAFDKSQHIDRWLGHKNKGNLKCYVANYFFCIQFDGFSDNVNQQMDYSHLLKKFKLLK